MAIFHLSVQVIGRTSGRSATAAAAYRAAARIVDQRTDETHDYTRKRGMRETFILAPDNAPAWMRDRSALWNGVEAIEKRKDAQLCREIEVSLPYELSHDQRRSLLVAFLQEEFVDSGMVADVAIHAPGREGDHRNEHAHCLLTLRAIDGGGFGNKKREWNSKELIESWRAGWAKRVNAVLEANGMAERVDHLSFARQAKAVGSAAEHVTLGTIHLGQQATGLERRGVRTDPGDINREVRVVNLEFEQVRRAAIAETLEQEQRSRVNQRDGLLDSIILQLGLSEGAHIEDARREIRLRRDGLNRIRLRVLGEGSALSDANQRLSLAMAQASQLNRLRADLQEHGRQIRSAFALHVLAESWRAKHPLLAVLDLLGRAIKIPHLQFAKAELQNIAELQTQWLAAKADDAQVQRKLQEALRIVEAARQEHCLRQREVEQETLQQEKHETQLIEQAEALLASLERMVTSQPEQSNEFTPDAPRPGKNTFKIAFRPRGMRPNI